MNNSKIVPTETENFTFWSVSLDSRAASDILTGKS